MPGGEVVILDTAGYGPMTINKSIKVIGPQASTAASACSAACPWHRPPASSSTPATPTYVTLRGLDIAGVPGARRRSR